MTCSNCGAENESNAKFCHVCGFPIVPESERPHPEQSDGEGRDTFAENNTYYDSTTEMSWSEAEEMKRRAEQKQPETPVYDRNNERIQPGQGQPTYSQNYPGAQQPYGYGMSQPNQPLYGMAGPVPQHQNQYSAASIVGLIMGIVSIVFCFTLILGIGCGVAAICLGASQRGREGQKTMATAALVLGIVGVSVTVLIFIVLIGTGFFAAVMNGVNTGGGSNYDWTDYSDWYDWYDTFS
ncbi:MAG: zinc-ribbon domain-containing protein [Eubacterium sp.]|nr:zinc-ribbon domain-containing protein [Eubacterium sp.]